MERCGNLANCYTLVTCFLLTPILVVLSSWLCCGVRSMLTPAESRRVYGFCDSSVLVITRNTTSSIKPEVHSVSQRRQTTGDAAVGDVHENLVLWTCTA